MGCAIARVSLASVVVVVVVACVLSFSWLVIPATKISETRHPNVVVTETGWPFARPGVDGVKDGGVVCRQRHRRRRLLRPYRRRSRLLVVASAVLVNPCQHELLTRGMGTHLPAGWWVHHLPSRSTQPVIVVGRRRRLSLVDVVNIRRCWTSSCPFAVQVGGR